MDDDAEQPAKPKKTKTYRCYGGPMDGAEVEANKVFAGEWIGNIFRTTYRTELRKPDDEFAVWQECKEGAGDSIVKYAHEKGGRLVFVPPKTVGETLDELEAA